MATTRKRNNTYQIRVSLGYDALGKQIIKTTTWRPPAEMGERQAKKEAERQAALFEQMCKNGTAVTENVRFREYAQLWMQNNGENMAPGTYSRYTALLGRINLKLGNVKVNDLRAYHLQELYIWLAKPGENKKTGKVLSNKTILHHHRLISTILGEAHKQGYALKNVSSLATPPKPKQRESTYLDEGDVAKLCRFLADAPIKWRTALLLLLYTGLRRGELAGLEWGDIDFDAQSITVRRTIQYLSGALYEYTDESGVRHKGQLIEKAPKTKSSQRIIIVCENTTALLREYKEWWIEEYGCTPNSAINKLFMEYKGKTINPDSLTAFARRFAKDNGLPHFTPHTLRHTNISLMIAAGVDLKTVATRAGHASITTTVNIYTHQIQSQNARAAQKIGSVLSFMQRSELADSSGVVD